MIFLRDALYLGQIEFVQQQHLLHVDQLEQSLADLDPDKLLLLLFVTWPKNFQACLFLNQISYFRVWEHVTLVIEDDRIDPEELLLKVPNFDVLPDAQFEKIVRQHLGEATVKSLLANWLEAQLPPKYFEVGVQIHENFLFLNQKTDSAWVEVEP